MNERFGLYLIVADPVAGFEAVAQAAVDCSVWFLQLRMKNTPSEELKSVATRLRDITRGSMTRFIVNDDLDVAIAVDADGVHLGQDDLSVAEARLRWNTPDKIFGLSTHSMEQARQALELKPDYIGVGPVFPTPTKTDTEPALGPEEAGRIMADIPITTVGIGGINAGNLHELMKAGILNFCVVRAVNAHPDPAAAIRELQKIWEKHFFDLEPLPRTL